MSKRIIILLITFTFITCSDPNNYKLNGGFANMEEESRSTLVLYNSKQFRITLSQRQGHDVIRIIKSIKGTYNVIGNTIYLKENWTWKKFSATIIDENRLVCISLPNNKKEDTLYCYVKFHPNGKRSMDLSWRNSKKDGLWQYWDEKGNFVCDSCFKDGVPSQDTMYCKPDTTQGLIL